MGEMRRGIRIIRLWVEEGNFNHGWTQRGEAATKEDGRWRMEWRMETRFLNAYMKFAQREETFMYSITDGHGFLTIY